MVTSASESVAGTARERRLPASERSELIEAAAARLFAERGLAATTMDDIAAAAGVSKPMLYRYFESKRDLQVKLLERRRDELAAVALQELLVRAGEPLAERIRAMLGVWLGHVAEHPDSSRVLLRDVDGDPQIRELQQDLRARQRAVDVALLREYAPGVPDEQLEPLGEVIRASLTALGLWWLDHPEVPREVVVDALARTTFAVLAAAS